MEILRLEIRNFRGIKEGKIDLNGHSLLIGGNNVGKSTVCEAIDLILGPERLSRYNVLNEHDFYKSQYLDKDSNLVVIEVKAVLSSLSTDLLIKYKANLGYWDVQKKTLLNSENEPEETDGDHIISVLPVEFHGYYDKEEDEFKAETSFSIPLKKEEQALDSFRRADKRKFGFLFLRTIRTGSRALSMEKGSLLDIILRLKEDDKTEMWESSLKALKGIDPPIHEMDQLSVILDQIENRINNFIKLNDTDNKLGFFVTNLTREKLRSAITFFATSEYDDTLVPFYQLGTGAINTLVFSMLTFIADLKGNVIFAMEEPEIALPPHTQRRIIKYVLQDMNQAIFTSHSPYVMEQFAPENIVILSKSKEGIITSKFLNLDGFKAKNFKGGIKHKYAEALLGKGVLLVEGRTEEEMFPAASDILEDSVADCLSLDVAGITVVNVDGDGNLLPHAKLFAGFGLDVHVFYDKQADDTLENEFEKIANHVCEIEYDCIERLLVECIPINRLQSFLDSIVDKDDFPRHLVKEARSTLSDKELKELLFDVLYKRKGSGYAAQLIYQCDLSDIPPAITDFITQIVTEQKFIAKTPIESPPIDDTPLEIEF